MRLGTKRGHEIRFTEGKRPNPGKKAASAGGSGTSETIRSRKRLAEEVKKSNEKLMEDIRKALNNIHENNGRSTGSRNKTGRSSRFENKESQ